MQAAAVALRRVRDPGAPAAPLTLVVDEGGDGAGDVFAQVRGEGEEGGERCPLVFRFAGPLADDADQRPHPNQQLVTDTLTHDAAAATTTPPPSSAILASVGRGAWRYGDAAAKVAASRLVHVLLCADLASLDAALASAPSPARVIVDSVTALALALPGGWPAAATLVRRIAAREGVASVAVLAAAVPPAATPLTGLADAAAAVVTIRPSTADAAAAGAHVVVATAVARGGRPRRRERRRRRAAWRRRYCARAAA